MMAKQMIQRLTFGCLALLLPLANLHAQMGGGDPTEEIKEIARAIDEQLKEIDKLLLESGRKGQTRKKPKELLQQAAEGSLTVQDGIEKLIEKLNEMKQKGSGQGQPSQKPEDSQKGSQGEQQQQQNGEQKGQQSQGSQQRRENETPEFVQQPQEGQKPGEQGQPDGQQEGQKPGEKRDGKPDGKGEQPMGGTENKDGGQNKVGNNPPNSATGPGQPGTGDGGWGDLQPYLNFLRNRGASPKVPEKFRKYYEAYLKRKGKDGKK